jgi:hypothetical protein
MELSWYPPNSRFGGRFRPGDALDHVGFVIGSASARALEQVYQWPIRAGARPTPVTPATTDRWMACVKDPDGNWIEILRQPTAAERRSEQRTASRARRRRG